MGAVRGGAGIKRELAKSQWSLAAAAPEINCYLMAQTDRCGVTGHRREAFDFSSKVGYYYQLPAIDAGRGQAIFSAFFLLQFLALFGGWRFLKDITMYAVIKTGGKQYRVANGEKLKVEQIPADIGQEIILDQVLMVGQGSDVKVGVPLVAGATVTVKVVSHGRADKVKIFKLRRRKHYQKHQGHRQNYTEIEVSAINA